MFAEIATARLLLRDLRAADAETMSRYRSDSLAPQFHNRGYATEALSAVTQHLFTTLRKHRISASVDPRNVRSVRVLQRLGFRKEAHMVQSLWFRGEWVDEVTFAMLAAEWARRQG